jgi:arsenate reductase (glutaredoxin)
VSIAEALGVQATVINYTKDKPDEATLRWLVDHLEDPMTDLVRRDSVFAKMGLTDADVATADQIVAVLLKTPRLMQRPVVVKGNTAIIGRPKSRVQDLLG